MSSREIASLIGRSHSNIKISAQRLSDSGVIGTLAAQEFTHNGNKYKEYLFDKRDSLVLVAQNCPEFTAAIVDRWQELEERHKFTIPQTLPEALRLAADLADQLEAAKPKIAAYDLLADRKGDVSTTVVAKEIGTTAIKLNKFLRDTGVKMLRIDAPKAGYEDWFNVVTVDVNGDTRSQCLITPTGQLEIAKLWSKK